MHNIGVGPLTRSHPSDGRVAGPGLGRVITDGFANTDYGIPWRVKQELRSLQKLVRIRAS